MSSSSSNTTSSSGAVAAAVVDTATATTTTKTVKRPAYQPMSLTPESRNAEASAEAMNEGLMNGFLTLVPMVGMVSILMQRYPGFVKRTNWQSRTAIAIMPALFVAAFTSEQRFVQKMREIAAETEHSVQTVQWAEQQMKIKSKQQQHQQKEQQQDKSNRITTTPTVTPTTHQQYQNQPHHETPGVLTEKIYLQQLYQHSVAADDNVRIVPGDTLMWYHRTANFISSNPIKVLASLAVPAVGYIYYGNSGKQHLEFSHKLLHTRVFGQFATISALLGVMGFKDFMDKNGKYISQAEANARVEELQYVRQQLLARLQYEHDQEEIMKREIAAAHEQDIQDSTNSEQAATTTTIVKTRKVKKHKKPSSSTSTATVDDDIQNAVSPTTVAAVAKED